MQQSKMVINYVPGEECRVAVLTDARLEEYHAEKANAVSLVGNVYVARVMNVEPAIQAAFVDFGHEANGFLHISDLHPQYFPGEDKSETEDVGRKTPRRERPPIQHCLRRGQEITVQVLKEGIGTKGPTLTSYVSIPGRYLVMLPGMDRVGVSRRVEDEDARKKMRQILDGLDLPDGFGFILRTAGMDRGKLELKRDLAYLQRLWKDIERRMSSGKGPRLLYAESDLLMRVLRDVWTADVGEIVIDNDSALQRAWRFMKIVSPRSSTKLLQYNRAVPIFHAFGVEEQLARIHSREVPLTSGGYLVIDETEALIAIDVNSGKMRSNSDAETTAYRTNVEAIDEICRQLKLRDVGGLVLCDLIDMSSRKNRRDIEGRFRERLKRDRAATRALPISQFGIVELTRQRQRGSFRSAHVAKCPMCEGRGVLRRPDSVAADALRELAAILEQNRVHKVELVVSPRVASELLSSKRAPLNRLEQSTHKHVDVRVSEDIGVDRVAMYAYEENGADIDIGRLPKPKPPTDLPEWSGDSSQEGIDWNVDIQQEEAEEAAPGEAVEPGAAAAPGATSEGELARRKRRRRRRGRGRMGAEAVAGESIDAEGPGGEGPGAEPPELPAAGESWDIEPTELSRPVHAGPARAAPGGEAFQGDGSASEGGRRRRRRRRRRGRGGEFGPAAPAGAPDSAPASNEHAPPRGDSWDLDPGAVTPHRGAMASDSLIDPVADEHEEPEAHEVAAGHTAREAGPSAPPSKEERPKRRRRRGGKRDQAAPDRDADKQAPAPQAVDGGEPGPGAGAGTKERKGRRRGGRGGRAKPGAEPKPPRSSPAEPKADNAATPSPNGAPGQPRILPPKRALYSARRRLSPTDAASLKGKRED